jgi:hypothetical protein
VADFGEVFINKVTLTMMIQTLVRGLIALAAFGSAASAKEPCISESNVFTVSVELGAGQYGE